MGALPSGVTAEWLPGLNQRPCRAALTHSGAAVARRLATLIDESKVVPPGAVFSCPLDDDSEVRLFFSYVGGGVRTIWVPLTGCAFLGDTSSRDLRMAAPTLLTTLRSIGPLPWRSQLYGGN